MTIFLGVAMFTVVVIALVLMILAAKKQLVASGPVKIRSITRKKSRCRPAASCSARLADAGVFVSSACGGGGTCAQCKVKIEEGGGDILATEKDHINKKEAAEGERLSCQVAVKNDMVVEVPPEAFDTKKWECTVRSNHNVATFIKEFVLELPEGEEVDFRAGGYIQIECPPHTVAYKDFAIEEKFREDWDKFDIWRYVSKVDEPVVRAYSMANYPGEKGHHHVEHPRGVAAAADARCASGKDEQLDLFSSNPVTKRRSAVPTVSSSSRIRDAEMVYIGGGAGMAPLRSHIFELFKRHEDRPQGFVLVRRPEPA